jgi:hypothetical protein
MELDARSKCRKFYSQQAWSEDSAKRDSWWGNEGTGVRSEGGGREEEAREGVFGLHVYIKIG